MFRIDAKIAGLQTMIEISIQPEELANNIPWDFEVNGVYVRVINDDGAFVYYPINYEDQEAFYEANSIEIDHCVYDWNTKTKGGRYEEFY